MVPSDGAIKKKTFLIIYMLISASIFFRMSSETREEKKKTWIEFRNREQIDLGFCFKFIKIKQNSHSNRFGIFRILVKKIFFF